MIRAPLIFAALLIFAPDADAQRVRRTHPAWMTGTWTFLSRGQERGPDMCNNDEVERFARNGRYYDDGGPGGEGRWWIEGDRLVRVETELLAGAGPDDKPSTTRQRFRRVAEDELRFEDDDWGPWRMVRCPDV
jgi:hypothetical protein